MKKKPDTFDPAVHPIVIQWHCQFCDHIPWSDFQEHAILQSGGRLVNDNKGEKASSFVFAL